MQPTRIDPSQVKGWGVDADPENDPTYPMKNRTNAEHRGYTWERPAQQPASVEVLHSNERPNLSAVFGTSTPPRGLSGMLRRFAFRYNESNYGHWLPLMAADRIGVIEGFFYDLAHGRFPNVFVERGWRADWKHSRPSLIARMIARVVLILGLALLVAVLRERSER
ncbi:MAG TPA: hypothetical protein VM940_02660 [Chthoniobacterales bacterium]|jgi:hypothetical protein|nr:hypothetical protein [Chthoniobacterales bacterium]